MSQNAFEMLKPEIRRFIYDQGWHQLRPIQEAAIRMTYGSDYNMILAAPTASGKTEAAFLPAISAVSNWNDGVKILYLSPLIALINDQFDRITELCEYLDIPVTAWHGEANQAAKNRLRKDPKGIVLITPESIEAMLTLRPGEARAMLSSIEWIIVDELHSFLGSNRGIQLRSLIERMRRFIQKPVRYVGMSATLSRESYADCKDFFRGDRETKVLLDRQKNALQKTIHYYWQESPTTESDMLDEIYETSQKENMLIFPNSRKQVEKVAVGLKKRAAKHNSPVRYFAHHSSVEKDLRLEAEAFAKEGRMRFAIACTSTLELGIDIGSVDSVTQVEAPPSASTLAQRLGRSGRGESIDPQTGERRRDPSILHLLTSHPWSLLQAIACLSLYQKETLDHTPSTKKPFDVLAHQILALLLQSSGMPFADLERLPEDYFVWKDIRREEVARLLEHMRDEEYIEVLDGPGGEPEAITGLAAERLIRGKDFFAMFETEVLFQVFHETRKIGELPLHPELQENVNIFLSGKIWKVLQIEMDQKKIRVMPANDGKPPHFGGSGYEVTTEVRHEMRRLLQTPEEWGLYADQRAPWAERAGDVGTVLSVMRKEFDAHADYHWIDSDGFTESTLTTFEGTQTNQALFVLMKTLQEMTGDMQPLLLNELESRLHGKTLRPLFERLQDIARLQDDLDPEALEAAARKYLLEHMEMTQKFLAGHKYAYLLPDDLKVEYVMVNRLDFEGAWGYLK